MKKLTLALLVAGLVSPFAVAADAPASPHTVTGNIGITSDYIFRGVTQTMHKPAIQGGFDYTNTNGLYVGTWLSNQTWVEEGGYMSSSSLEIDLYGGYRGTVGDIGYDVGAIKYYYPGGTVLTQTPNTVEAYVGVSYGPVSLKYSQVLSDYFIGWSNGAGSKSKNSSYLELNATHDLGAGWGVLAHVGQQKVKTVADADYTDWKVGVTKDVGYGVVTVAYSDTDAKPTSYSEALGNPAGGRAFV